MKYFSISAEVANDLMVSLPRRHVSNVVHVTGFSGEGVPKHADVLNPCSREPSPPPFHHHVEPVSMYVYLISGIILG